MTRAKTVVVALGGNAILQPGQKGTAREQFANVEKTCRQVAAMVRRDYRVVLTHGNGPQVGNILIQNEAAADQVPPMPMDVCGAQSQGQIGYMLQNCLRGVLAEVGEARSVVSVVTQMVVDAGDPAFRSPTKPVGPFCTEEEARRTMEEKGETWVEDAGRGWRRVVPSPDPIRIVEKEAIMELVRAGVVVVANGGGGIPVIEEGGRLRGVEAVIDKDLGAQRLAVDVQAELFLILTDVPKVALNFRGSQERWLDRVSLAEIERYQREGHFKPGSMGPKVEACRRFLAGGGERAVIASLEEALAALEGKAGTQLLPN